LRKCKQCGKNSLKRLIGTGAGVIFKGSGFYETDYRSESYKQAQKKETDAGKEKKESKKTDGEKKSKPAEKSPAKSNTKKDNKKSA
jgi:predicted nucleic acid-binding Zn ribbon protein